MVSSRSRRTTLGAISNNRRVSLAAGVDTNHGSNNHGGTHKQPNTRSRKQRMSMAPRMMSSSNDGANHTNTNHTNTKSKPSTSTGRTPSRRKTMGGYTHTNAHGGEPLKRSEMSIIPNPAAVVIKNDPRPISSDKSYFNSCIRQLHTFLDAHDYPDIHSIKLRDLSNPSSKDVKHIMTFLLQLADPEIGSIGVGGGMSGSGRKSMGMNGSSNMSIGRKFEEDVTNVFKKLGYPFNISKTALVAAGSPHTWPTLLAAIMWIVDLITMVEEDDEGSFVDEGFVPLDSVGVAGGPLGLMPGDDDEESENENNNNEQQQQQQELHQEQKLHELEDRTERAFLQYLENSYEYFLYGQDEYFEQQEVEVLEYFDKDNNVILSSIEEEMVACDAIPQQEAEIMREMEDLPERQKRLEDLATDIEKFHSLVQQLNEHKNTLEKKVQESTLEVEQKRIEVQEKRDKIIPQLKTLIDTQQYTKEDVYKLEREVKNMEETIQQVARVKRGQEDLTLKHAMDLKKCFEEMYCSVEEYNAQVEGSSSLLSSSSSSSSPSSSSIPTSQYLISIQKCSAHEEDQSLLLGGVDVKKVLLPTWTKERRTVAEQSKKLRRDVMSLTDEKEESEQALSEMKDEEEILTQEKRRAEDTKNREKNEQTKSLELRNHEIQETNDKAKHLRNFTDAKDPIVEYERQLVELESLRKKHQDENLSRKQSTLQEVNDFMRGYADLQVYRDTVMKELKEYKDRQEEYSISLAPEDEALLSK